MSEHKVRRRKKQQQQPDTVMQDVSSQEEDMPNRNPLPNPIEMPPDLSALVNYHITPIDELPVIKSIQQVVREFPHMQNNKMTGLPNCEEANNKFVQDMKSMGHDVQLAKTTQKPELPVLSSSTHTSYEVKHNHYMASEVNPWNQAVFREKIERVKVPNWYYVDSSASTEQVVQMNQMDQTTLNDLLRKGVLELPEQRADLESELLAEAGQWTNLMTNQLVDFPPCVFEHKCLGQTILLGELKGLTKPITLMQILYRQEYMELLKHGSGNYPKRPCVLCNRHALADWVTTLRADKMHGGNGLSQCGENFEDKTNQILQWYRNPRNQPNGYDKDFMLTEEPGEPIIHPIVTLNLAQLECKTLRNGRRYIDQRSILYKPPPTPVPKVGESLQVF